MIYLTRAERFFFLPYYRSVRVRGHGGVLDAQWFGVQFLLFWGACARLMETNFQSQIEATCDAWYAYLKQSGIPKSDVRVVNSFSLKGTKRSG